VVPLILRAQKRGPLWQVPFGPRGPPKALKPPGGRDMSIIWGREAPPKKGGGAQARGRILSQREEAPRGENTTGRVLMEEKGTPTWPVNSV